MNELYVILTLHLAEIMKLFLALYAMDLTTLWYLRIFLSIVGFTYIQESC